LRGKKGKRKNRVPRKPSVLPAIEEKGKGKKRGKGITKRTGEDMEEKKAFI